jgi:hypothetical protein
MKFLVPGCKLTKKMKCNRRTTECFSSSYTLPSSYPVLLFEVSVTHSQPSSENIKWEIPEISNL